MNKTLHAEIWNEAQKLVRRHQQYASNLAASLKRREARSSIAQLKDLRIPRYWSADRGFNPYHVRANAFAFAHSIDNALKQKIYRPRPAVKYEVPKKDGTMREVSVFQVADNAVSRLTFQRLMEKNARHMSSHAYAYRDDLGIHDAILHISSDFYGRSRIFIAEFDFRKYFDSISHDHIWKVLRDRRFFLTDREQRIIDGFLKAPTFEISKYVAYSLESREEGVPQGTSISLFLANVAAYPLDRRLEQLGVGFARYADDTLIWAPSYASICDAANALEEIAADMGVQINFLKSEGISILAPEEAQTEMRDKRSISFIGYQMNAETISIRDESLLRAKNHLSYLIYSNLLQWPKKGVCNGDRVKKQVDSDYASLLYQLRRYLYGELSESQLRKFMARQTPLMRYHGLMSFYPVLSDEKQLKELDGWLLNSVYRSLRLRAKLFKNAGIWPLPLPHGQKKETLLNLKLKGTKGIYRDLRLPSVARISKLIRRAARTYGASKIAHPQSSKYHTS